MIPRSASEADDLMTCLMCDGLGYGPCDDGSENQCEHCDGIGKVPAGKAETKA
jgi:hypothetical protein